MRISIFGLGYVGAVTAACLARDGHHVIGVDVNAEKVARRRRRALADRGGGLDGLLARPWRDGRIDATTDARAAVAATDVSMITVGTPPLANGEPDLEYVERVCGEIARRRQGPRQVPRRGPAGAPCRRARWSAAPELFAAEGADVHLAFNPEFLREGSAIRDYDTPAYTIIGTTDAIAEREVRELYASVAAPVIVVEPAVAEMVKYVANALARDQDRLRQRGGPAGEGLRRRWSRRDGGDRRGHQAERLGGVPATGVRVRRFVPAQGRRRACSPRRVGTTSPCRCWRAVPVSNAQQIELAVAGGARVTAPPRRGAGSRLQARHRRPAREPRGAAREAPARGRAARCVSTTAT